MENRNVNCPFCKGDDIKSRIVYLDNLIIIFPTNIPITPGHMLVCPVRHVATIDKLTNEELFAILKVIVRLKKALRKSLYAKGFNVAWNEKKVAGQLIDHLHIHVVPRKKGDSGIYKYEPRKFLYRQGSRKKSPIQELKEVAQLIKKNL